MARVALEVLKRQFGGRATTKQLLKADLHQHAMLASLSHLERAGLVERDGERWVAK